MVGSFLERRRFLRVVGFGVPAVATAMAVGACDSMLGRPKEPEDIYKGLPVTDYLDGSVAITVDEAQFNVSAYNLASANIKNFREGIISINGVELKAQDPKVIITRPGIMTMAESFGKDARFISRWVVVRAGILTVTEKGKHESVKPLYINLNPENPDTIYRVDDLGNRINIAETPPIFVPIGIGDEGFVDLQTKKKVPELGITKNL